MDIELALRHLGLPKHSGDVFQALEAHEPASPSELARVTKLHRPSVYRALEALLANGFAHKRRARKRAVYLASERHTIEHALQSAGRSLVRDAPRSRLSPARSVGMIEYFEGPEGIGAIFDDVVTHSKRGDTFYRYTSERNLDEVNGYLSRDYRARRDAKQLERLVISNPESGSRKRKRLERFIKFLGTSKESFHENAIQLIYGSRVAFIDLNTKRGLVVDNKTLADFQRTIFRALYRRL